jgi:hypothetical protein
MTHHVPAIATSGVSMCRRARHLVWWWQNPSFVPGRESQGTPGVQASRLEQSRLRRSMWGCPGIASMPRRASATRGHAALSETGSGERRVPGRGVVRSDAVAMRCPRLGSARPPDAARLAQALPGRAGGAPRPRRASPAGHRQDGGLETGSRRGGGCWRLAHSVGHLACGPPRTTHHAHPYRWTYTGQPLVQATPFSQTRRQQRQGRARFSPWPHCFDGL